MSGLVENETHNKPNPAPDVDLDVSIVVVSFNTREMTIECLHSIVRETERCKFEVLVLDNDSTDGSFDSMQDEFHADTRFHLIASPENLGFAQGNNALVDLAKGKYVLLLNPDTVVLDGAIDRLVEFAEANPEHGIWGGRTIFEDGSLNPTNCWGHVTVWSQISRYLGLTKLSPTSALFNPRGYVGWSRESVRVVDIVTGCFFLMRVADWRRLGGFDKAFFMYGEEVDLCMRAAAIGVTPIVTPEATIIHHGGASEKVPEEKHLRLLHAERKLFSRHWSWLSSETVRVFMYLGLFLRAMVAGVSRAESKNIWWSLLRRRRSWDSGD